MRDAILLLGFVTLQRLFELLLSRRNEARLKRRGAVEAGAKHYPFMVLLHVVWLGALWLLAWDKEPNMLLVAAFLALQPLRYWVIATLGDRWTTRVFVIPGASLVRAGPYRFFSHPNYLIVISRNRAPAARFRLDLAGSGIFPAECGFVGLACPHRTTGAA